MSKTRKPARPSVGSRIKVVEDDAKEAVKAVLENTKERGWEDNGYTETPAQRKERLGKVKDLPKKLKKMETRTVSFDLDKAEAWFERNTSNRPISKAAYKRFAEQMHTGEFRTTSQGISVNKRGKVQDGQHRLLGVKYYYENYPDPQPVEMRVTEGEEDNFPFFDQGRNRSAADVFAIDKHDYPGELAIASRLLWIRYHGKRVAGAGKASPYELMEFAKEFPGLEKSVRFIMKFGQDEDSLPCKELMSPGYAAALHFLMLHADGVDNAKKAANDFWTQVIEQDARKGTAPYYLYRKLKKMKLDPTVKLTRDATVDFTIEAFNRFVDGDKTRLPTMISDRPQLGGYDGAGADEDIE